MNEMGPRYSTVLNGPVSLIVTLFTDEESEIKLALSGGCGHPARWSDF